MFKEWIHFFATSVIEMSINYFCFKPQKLLTPKRPLLHGLWLLFRKMKMSARDKSNNYEIIFVEVCSILLFLQCENKHDNEKISSNRSFGSFSFRMWIPHLSNLC